MQFLKAVERNKLHHKCNLFEAIRTCFYMHGMKRGNWKLYITVWPRKPIIEDRNWKTPKKSDKKQSSGKLNSIHHLLFLPKSLILNLSFFLRIEWLIEMLNEFWQKVDRFMLCSHKELLKIQSFYHFPFHIA
jgi:hypothetical protein